MILSRRPRFFRVMKSRYKKVKEKFYFFNKFLNNKYFFQFKLLKKY